MGNPYGPLDRRAICPVQGWHWAMVPDERTKAMRYGHKGGDGPTDGKVAAVYAVTTPDGHTVRKSSFKATAPEVVDNGFVHNGKHVVALWPTGAIPAAWTNGPTPFWTATARRVK